MVGQNAFGTTSLPSAVACRTYHQCVIGADSLGAGMELSDADWRGLSNENLDLSLMVLHRLDLRGSAFPNVLAVGTGFDCCNFDGALLSRMTLTDWTSSTFLDEDPLEFLPRLDPRSEWDPGSFELIREPLDEYSEEIWGDAFMSRWKRNANVFGSSFRGASLRFAGMSGISISQSDCSGADFSRANLSGTTLEDVSLKGANLLGANLSRSTFRRVELSGAELTGAIWEHVTIEEVTFDGVVGLDLH